MSQKPVLDGVERRRASDEAGTDAWIDNEVVGCEFEDVRHGKRLRQLLEQLSSKVGAATPWACQDWANTKAAYRFFGNERISEANILAGHFSSTRDRFAAAKGLPILILHDTTEFSYRHEDTASIGILKKLPTSAGKPGPPRYYTSCGILMHSSLVTTGEGLPLGLAAIKFWNRDKFHGANALKRRINPTRVRIEKKESIRWLENLRQSTELLGDPKRCVHIGDRESDIYELFCLAQQLGTHFLVRTCVDRLAGEGTTTVAAEMKDSELRGLHSLQVRNRRGELSTAVLEMRFRRMVVRPPISKQKDYPKLFLTAIHATERTRPKDREKIDWKLLTDLPVRSCLDAIEKLEWYAQRWKIGVSSQGHINQPVKVRPRLTDSSLVAWEASWSESETAKPSDNMLRKEYAQLTRLQRAVNADVASLHANPEAETVDNVRKQQEPIEMSPMRRLSPAGYQRRHGEKENVATGEALGVRRRNLVEEATAITASGKCRRRRQGGGSGRTTVDGRAAKRVRREGPGPVSIPFYNVRQG
ncbi:MAG: IS4 family transposase [Terracidiphilus sp.]